VPRPAPDDGELVLRHRRSWAIAAVVVPLACVALTSAAVGLAVADREVDASPQVRGRPRAAASHRS
jgi:hypothetical protein